MPKSKTYDEFVEKFKTKKTTDDCYTPPLLYEEIKKWVVEKYGLENYNVVRPFFPNGDYTKNKYDSQTVVIDNPPFSILSKIIDYYIDNNVKFFLFGPSLTMFSYINRDVTLIITNSNIIYENGAKVKTGFITNLDTENKVIVSLELSRIIKKNSNRKKNLPKYNRPKNVLTATDFARLEKLNYEFKVKKSDCLGLLRNLYDENGKKIKTYGNSIVITDEKASEIEPITNRYYKEDGLNLYLNLTEISGKR